VNLFSYIFVNIIETLLRVIPFPCKTGLIEMGNPDRNSPVFITCNYHLTVERIKRVLGGIDCFLLVTNSRGHNVWCGSTGGHFTNHNAISILKTSGIEELVNHRNVILPQLAATGIESTIIKKKTGWKVIWGPVYAKDIPAFIENKFKKTPQMREVKFPLIQRIEMAVMWAFPFSIIASIIIVPWWPGVFLPLNALIWGLPILVFVSFPLYSKWLNPKKKGTSFSKYTVILDFGRIPLFLWAIFLICLVIWSVFAHAFTWGFTFRWGFVSFVILLLISSDLMGSTPVYKSGLHEDRFLKVILDEEKCKGAGFCELVCPRNCYEVDRNRHIAAMPRLDQCVQCGACIVQCPFDALHFETPKGIIIYPETIRKFKLNLIGKRFKETKVH
jgi:NAD-dependent dihydropyrimidine dehydrogenase PreA subunit